MKYSDADRAEIQRQLTEQYISDYTATWRAGMDNLNIRNFESIGQLTGALEQVISGDQPLQRALTVLRDNTQPGVFSEKLSAKEREEALAEPDYQLLTRLGHEFAPENSTLAVQKDKESTMQAVYQQLTELHRYLLAIQNAPVPGKSALKAVQLRLDQNSSDPIFATRQMAKTLPAPLNRWVGRLTDQAWHVVMVEAVHYMEVDWRDSVVKPFNEQLANNYPFNPRSAQDASLDAFERFFKPDGILDTFYQQNLKLFIDNDLSLEDGDNNVIIREDIIAQLETAQKIRDIFFSKQNGLGTSFAVETVSLSGNKRRSVLNLDGQLVDYSQGRNYTAHLVWPNNMREGNESKLTLIGTSGNAPRSISFSGPWAQFRLFGAGQLTGVQDGNFTVRFSVDGGAMTYRVHTDTEDNPFSGGLFSQFGLSPELENYERRLQQLLDTSPVQPLETGMQMMRVADSRWPESLQQQQASTQWNEALKTRAQSSPQLRGWLQTRQDLHAFADLVMQREKEGLTLSYIKNVIWQAERGLGQETPVESLLTQYQDARAQKQNTDALEKQINERLEGVLSRWLLLKNNVMPEAATGTTAEK